MSEGVTLSVNSELDKIIADLMKLKQAGEEVSKTLGDTGKAVGEEFQKTVKQSQTMVERVGGFARNFLSNLKNDFKTLANINMLKSGLQLNEMFRGTIKEAVSLSDVVRKLGPVFGIAQKDFSAFSSTMMKNLGDVGISSEAAVNSLQGLAETPVRGQRALMEYSKTASQVAQLSGTSGQEGDIAKGIARVIGARGGNVNDLKEMRTVADDLRKAFNAVGKAPAETLQDMEKLFSNMPEDLRKKVGTKGAAALSAASAQAGPGSMAFFEEFLGKSPIARMALEQQGFKDVIGEGGLNIEQFQKSAGAILERINFDPRMAAQTLGLSQEAAEGFVRMARSAQQMDMAQKKVMSDRGNIGSQQRGSMGMKEAFESSTNRVKAMISEPLAYALESLTGGLAKAGESDLGAGAVVGGGAALAALLTGGGISGLASSLSKNVLGKAKTDVLEQLTGEQIQQVFVVNTEDFPGGAGANIPAPAGLTSKLGTALKTAGKGLGVAAIGAGAYMLGSLASDAIAEKTKGKTEEGFEGDIIERGIQKVGRNVPGSVGDFFKSMENPPPQKVKVEVKVDLNKKELKGSAPKTRGASN